MTSVMRYPAKSNSLQALKKLGVEIGTVIDVGAQVDTPELRLNFPDTRHLLFEPAREFHDDLRRNYGTLDHEIFALALSDEDGTGRLQTNAATGQDVTHASLTGGSGGAPVAVSRLDTALADRADAKPYLLKVDVDGHELPVLRGVGSLWPDIACVIVEATLASLLERLTFVSSQGFRLIDIVDQCYYRGVLAQVDLVLLAERYFDEPEFRSVHTAPFDWEQWIPIAHFEPVALHEAAIRPIYGKRIVTSKR